MLGKGSVFVENFFYQLGTQLPVTSLGYTVDIDEITGQPKTYATSYNWESIDNPIHRALLSTLNPLEVFKPTQEKDYGIAGVIYNELNRLHGKGAYPRFIGRNFLNTATGQKLDDVQFNRVKEIFARLNCSNTFRCVMEERKIIKKLGGDCGSPIAVFAKQKNKTLKIIS